MVRATKIVKSMNDASNLSVPVEILSNGKKTSTTVVKPSSSSSAKATTSSSVRRTSTSVSSSRSQVKEEVPVKPNVVVPVNIIEENLEELVVDEAILQDESIKQEIAEGCEEDEMVVVDETITSEKTKRTKRAITKESYFNDFQNFFKTYETELNEKKNKLLYKSLRQLMLDSFKLLRISRNFGSESQNKTEKINSGFLKPVQITQELADFIRVDVNEPITRVMITKLICQYIKEKDLQNPKDRRQIILDVPLLNLFRIPLDCIKSGENKTTYYQIQKHMREHIIKI
jgi:chromatin remodeling complex protein RSC6